MSLIDIILLQFMGHLLGDFYFQSEKSCERKEFSEKNSKKTCFISNGKHCLVIWIFSALGFLFAGVTQSGDSFFYGLAIVGSFALAAIHLLIDLVKSRVILENIQKKIPRQTLFFYDQLAHIFVILFITYLLYTCEGSEWMLATSFFTRWIAYILAFLFLCKPANIIIKYILDGFKIEMREPKENDGAKSIDNQTAVLNAGRLIGACERILLLLLLTKGLYTEAGLILGAKSILRYENRGKNEYVLVGTLLSVTVVVAVYVALALAGFASL